MVFNSLTFLIFFAVVLLLHYSPLPWAAKKFNLLLASYLFYAAWNPPLVVLLWVSSLVDWTAAAAMARCQRLSCRRLWLLISLSANLGLLGFFKYGNFLLDNFVALVRLAGIAYQPPALDIVLPVGISFYTFQTLSYTIDVYRRKIAPCRSLLDYLLYVTFFPQLVAGPIVWAGDFLPQLREPKRATAGQLGWGLCLLTLGLFEKVVLADFLLAPVADTVFAAAASTGFTTAWLGVLAFSGQIFFDFAGYSTCAIGVALCLGFVLTDNFRFPYASIGFSDFWRRWHISLSTWLRDYLYISLGGNRRGTLRTFGNLMTTMLLGGLWHGASWRFVAWGGLHGLYLVVERLLRHVCGEVAWLKARPMRLVLALATFVLVCVAWVFFRAQDFPTALQILERMFLGGPSAFRLSDAKVISVLAVVAGTLLLQWWLRDASLEELVQRLPAWMVGGGCALMLVTLFLVPGDNRAFIYFQF